MHRTRQNSPPWLYLACKFAGCHTFVLFLETVVLIGLESSGMVTTLKLLACSVCHSTTLSWRGGERFFHRPENYLILFDEILAFGFSSKVRAGSAGDKKTLVISKTYT